MRYSTNYITGSDRNSWIEFFKNHQNIKKFNCILDWADEGFFEFLAELRILDEIRIQYFDQFNIDFISQIIANNKNLITFEIQVYSFDQIEVPDLALYNKEFGNEWHITKIDIC